MVLIRIFTFFNAQMLSSLTTVSATCEEKHCGTLLKYQIKSRSQKNRNEKYIFYNVIDQIMSTILSSTGHKYKKLKVKIFKY